MKITITKNEKEFDCTAAWRIIGQILNKPESVIGLSTGRTTGNLHRLVGGIYTKYPFKVDTVTFFGLDEVTKCAARVCRSMLHDAENGTDGYIGHQGREFLDAAYHFR